MVLPRFFFFGLLPDCYCQRFSARFSASFTHCLPDDPYIPACPCVSVSLTASPHATVRLLLYKGLALYSRPPRGRSHFPAFQLYHFRRVPVILPAFIVSCPFSRVLPVLCVPYY